MKANPVTTSYKIADASCSETQLVLLLLDSAIRYTREASEHLRNGNWQQKGQAVDSAMLCFRELRNSLDLKAGGESAEHIDRMYDFLATKVTVANIHKDPSQFDQVVHSLADIRSAWGELFERLRENGTAESAPETAWK